MYKISAKLIEQAVYELCYRANICLNNSVYSNIYSAFETEKNIDTKNYLKNILYNAKIAFEEKIPLCQDTGQVIVFMEIGQNVIITDEFIEDAVNSAVQKCYNDNFFRKSIVKNAVFDRINTKTNTPAIIYTKYTKSNNIKIKVLIKGAGSENKSKLEMLLPTSNEEDIIKKCSEMILSAGINACPPMFIGIGIGATAEKALLMSKEALLETDFTHEENILAQKIKHEVNKQATKEFENCFVLDVKLKTSSTHIACMPVAVTINCHSDRFSTAVISDNRIIYQHKTPDFKTFEDKNENIKEINSSDIESLKLLKQGENILLSGEIYVARDMAHKKIFELINKNKPLPFNLKDKIIFYAGPCPCQKDKVIGSIGPTTASRMDKYAIKLYEKGILATIGKGTRSNEVMNYIRKNNKKYFTLQGGIASLLSKKVIKNEIIAFEELGAEAVYKIYVEKFPLKIE